MSDMHEHGNAQQSRSNATTPSQSSAATPSQSEVFAASEPFSAADGPFLGIDGFNAAGPTPVSSPLPHSKVDATCMDVHRSLSVFLDGELAIHQANAVQRHLSVCGPCQSAQAFQMQLRTTVAAKAIDPMPADVRERITRALGFDQPFGETDR